MNFGLMISCKVEDKLAAIHRGPEWSQHDEAQAYERALKEVVEEDGRAWADGNIRVGDYILISMFMFPLKLFSPFFPPTILTLKQSTQIPAFHLTVFWMPYLKWSSRRMWESCSSHQESCR